MGSASLWHFVAERYDAPFSSAFVFVIFHLAHTLRNETFEV